MTSPLSTLSASIWRSQSNQEIATQLGLNLAYVTTYRRTNKKPKGPRSPGSGRPAKYDLSEIDWSRSNNDNAALLGCTSTYIALLRRQKAVSAEDFA